MTSKRVCLISSVNLLCLLSLTSHYLNQSLFNWTLQLTEYLAATESCWVLLQLWALLSQAAPPEPAHIPL